ncbi:MAG: hypothetical protein HYY47_01460 [Deltaproteobacteria bacterium]|nr:hypothetical protein [Deltaproteobacteria bacterium]
MLRVKTYVSLFAILSLPLSGPVMAGPSEGETVARQGVIRCGGNHFLRLSGAEAHTTFYVLRNYNSADSISIDRMIAFEADGSVLFDSNVSGLPPTTNGILGPTDNVLQPNQTAQFDSSAIVPSFLAQTDRPIQLEIRWSAADKVLILDVSLVRLGRQRDAATGAIQVERSRMLRECTSISLR